MKNHAVPANHGKNEAFSTGSQTTNRPSPIHDKPPTAQGNTQG